MMTASRIRVLVVDDSVVVRKLLTKAMREDPAIDVVGTASNGLIALQRIAQFSPEVVTLDVEMPELDGLSTVREIKRQYPRVRIIMCSTLCDRGAAITMEALSLGADDYVAKSTSRHGDSSFHAMNMQLIAKIKQFFPHTGGTAPAPRPSFSPKHGRGARLGAIAIGVSTGGPNALAAIIPMLPANLSVPVFVVQHMPPMFTRLLAERLQTSSSVTVVEAADGMLVAPGHVYVAPGNFHMKVGKSGADTVIQLNQDPLENSCRPAVDVLFRSVGDVYGGATVSVILTGMGQDGLRGVEMLRSLGGYVIAQDEASSVVWGMPGFVARAGLADAVCGLNEVAPEILRQL